VNPGDVTALKHLLSEMNVDATVLFEIESFDSPLMPKGDAVSEGLSHLTGMKVVKLHCIWKKNLGFLR